MDLSDALRASVMQASADTVVELVLEWDAAPALAAAAGKTTRTEKRDVMSRTFTAAKQPVLRDLAGVKAVVVNDIAGSAHAVVSAPAARWRELFQRKSLVEAHVRLRPNTEIFAVAR